MTRAEAIKALIAGKKVERFALFDSGELVQRLSWHETEGLIVHYNGDSWTCEGGGYQYREVFEPRVFLGVWEEVKTFEDAEPANEDGSKRFMWDEVDEEILSFKSNIGMSQGDCWVRRKATP